MKQIQKPITAQAKSSNNEEHNKEKNQKNKMSQFLVIYDSAPKKFTYFPEVLDHKFLKPLESERFTTFSS